MRVALIVAATAIGCGPALAADDAKICTASKADGYAIDRIIEACTTYIASVEYSATKAAGYYNRGNAYFDQADWINAIADYSAALKLRPNYPTAMFNRGLAKKHMGDNAGGDADIAASKAMNAD